MIKTPYEAILKGLYGIYRDVIKGATRLHIASFDHSSLDPSKRG